MIKLRKQFAVDRSKWGPGFLHNAHSGCRCCLGHHAAAGGATTKQMSGWGLPYVLVCDGVSRTYARFAENAALQDISRTNDTDEITPAQKERRLKRQFAKLGITVTFFGELSEAMRVKSATTTGRWRDSSIPKT